MRETCFYHAGCPDGFGAAWSVWRAWSGKGRFVAAGHEEALDARELRGATVVFVDIAPRNDLLRDLARESAQLVVLDHHVTARDRYEADPELARLVKEEGHCVRFDLAHSGAMLAWNHFHESEPAPELIRYVEDQDLWNWRLPRSEEVNAAIGSYPHEFETWDELARREASALAEEGAPILRANRREVDRAVKTAHCIAIADARAEAVNSRFVRSSIGHELAKRAAFGRPWGVVYRVAGERVDVSIYSIGDLDISKVAASYGGGGHRNASGFSVSLREWLDRFVV